MYVCGIEVYLPEVWEESGKIQMLSSKLDIIRQLKLEINLVSNRKQVQISYVAKYFGKCKIKQILILCSREKEKRTWLQICK